ncbi:MAG: putative repeat protein (TIGR01451 family), partial [Rhodothermales bacterium]
CLITVDVVAAATGDYTNTSGSLTSSLGDSGTSTATLRVNAPPVFTKAFSPDPGVAGSAITLTFTVNNTASTASGTSLAFTDNLPSGMVVASPALATSTCIGGALVAPDGAASISMSGSSVAAGASCTISANVVIATSGAYTNTTSGLTSSLGTSLAATADIHVDGSPLFSKAFDPVAIQLGQISTLTFTIVNEGSSAAASSAVFTDSFPPGLVVASTPNVVSTCSAGELAATPLGTSVTLSGGTVDPGSTCTFSVDVEVTAAGVYENLSGALTSSLGTSSTASATLTAISVDVSSGVTGELSMTAGTGSDYTLTAANAGPSAASGVVATLVLGDGLTVTGSECGITGSAFVWNVGGLDSGASEQCVVSVAASADASGTTSVSMGVTNEITDTDATNDQASISVGLTSSADLAVTKTGPASVVPGQSATFSIQVTNLGPSVATDLVITDTPSAGLTLESLSEPCVSGVPCTVASLAVGEVLTVTTLVAVPSDAVGPLINSSTVSAATPDPVVSNNSATASVTASPSADLTVSKTGPDVVIPGMSASYVVTVTNLGPSDAAGVSLADPTPAGLSLASVTGACSVLPCTLGEIVAGASQEVTIEFNVPPTLDVANVVNTATATATTADADASNNTTSVTASVQATADLALTKTGFIVASGVSGANRVTYSITVTNFGPSGTSGVQAVDNLPSSMTVVDVVVGSGSFNRVSGLWDIGVLASGASASLEITTETVEAGEVPNTAEVTASSATDPNSTPGNGVAEENDQETAIVVLQAPVGDMAAPTTDPLGGLVTFFAPGVNGSDAGAVSRVSASADTESSGTLAGLGDLDVGLSAHASKTAASGDVLLYAGSRGAGVFRLVLGPDDSRSWEMVSPSLGLGFLETNALATGFDGGSPRLGASFLGAGVFESEDRGLTWAEITGSLDTATIRVMTRYDGAWLVGTRASGVLRSGNWALLAAGLESADVRDIAVVENQVYAATWGSGVFREVGGNWVPVTEGLGSMQVTTLSALGTRLLAGTWGGGVLELRGTIWTAVGTSLDKAFVQDVAAVGQSGAIAVTRTGIFEYDPATDSWESLDRGVDDGSVVSVGLVRDEDGRVVELHAGTVQDWVVSISEPGGSESFGNTEWQPVSPESKGLLVKSIAFGPSGSLYAAVEDGGVFHSSGTAAAYTLLNDGLPTRDLRVVLWLEGSGAAGRLVAGTDQGVFILNDDNADAKLGIGDTWMPAAGTGGMPIQSIGRSASGLAAGTLDGVLVSTDDGLSWQMGGLRGRDVRSLTGLSAGANLFAGTVLAGVQRSTNAGVTWTSTAGGVGGPVNSVTALGTNVFAGTPQGVYVSSDLGTTWTLMSFEGLAKGVLSLSAVSPGVVYAGTNFGGAFFLVDSDRDGAYGDEQWMRHVGVGDDILIGAVAVSPISADVYLGSTDGRIFRTSEPVGVAVGSGEEVPEGYVLGQNYPNPFNPVTTIPFALPTTGEVEMVVFDVTGREVAVLVSGVMQAGYHTAVWDAQGAPSGVYLYRITADGFTQVRRLVLLK